MADINAQAGQVLGVAQPPVANNQPKDLSDVQSYKNQLEGLIQQREGLTKGLGALNQGLATEQGAIAQGKQQQAEIEASGTAAAKQQQYNEQQTAQKEYKQLLEQNALPAFVPTKDSGMDLAKLMSSMAVMGTLMGRNGSGQSAINAMAAMKGMMTGWQEGRQDLYKKESDEFNKNYNRMLKIHGEFRQEMEDAIKLASTNKELSEAKAHEAAVKLGSPIVMHQVREGNFKAAIESVKAMDKLTADMQKNVAKLLSDAKKRETDLEVARIRAQGAVNVAQQRVVGSAANKGWKTYETKSGKIIRYNSETGDIEGGDFGELVGAKLLGATQKTSGGAANDRYAFNITESFSQAATDLLNISQMPGNTVLGVFAGMTGQTGDTLIKSLTNTFSRQLTKEDSRLMQQIVAGLDQNMARALGGGYATSTSKGLIQAYKEQVAQFGDSPLAQAMFLSRMKQELEILARAFEKHPGAKEGYVSDMKEYVSELNKSIPFNVSDVIAANRGQKQTVTDKFSYLAQKPVSMKLPEEGEPVKQFKPATAPAATSKPQGSGTKEDPIKLD